MKISFKKELMKTKWKHGKEEIIIGIITPSTPRSHTNKE